MNNKILSVVLVAGIATTGFAGISAAKNSETGIFSGDKSEIRELMQKSRSGEELSSEEQATLDTAKSERGEKGAKFGGKRKGGGNLTDEEKTALESMSDDERKAFFDKKKAEMDAQREAHKSIMDKLINGESLSTDEEATRLEMIAKMENVDGNHKGRGDGEGKEIISKILAGDELTVEEEASLAEMQEKRAEREAQRALMQPIKEKLRAGEELTQEEQAILDEHKGSRGERKGKGNRGER